MVNKGLIHVLGFIECDEWSHYGIISWTETYDLLLMKTVFVYKK